MNDAICFIGNSHLSAYKLAFDAAGPAVSGVRSEIFAAPVERMGMLTLEEHLLVPPPHLKDRLATTSGGKTQIDCDAYGAFVLVGLIDTDKYMSELCAPFHPHPYARHPAHLVSEACFRAAAEGLVESSVAVSVARKIRQVSDAPVILVPRPFVSEALLAASDANPYKNCVPDEFARWALRAFKTALDTVAARHGAHALIQEDETMSRPLFTRSCYSMVSGRFPDGDIHHKTMQFAERMIERVLQTLKSLNAPAGSGRTRMPGKTPQPA